MAYTTINKPSDYFNTKLYTGNGGTNAITGVEFQPDFTWIKRRDNAAWHYLFDSIRGANKTLYSNLNSAESTDTNNLQSFDSDGFTVGTQADMNQSGGTFASWNWKANGAGVANTDGSISSTVSANTTSGFSIVSYTGTGSSATVGHGLGASPDVVIIKKTNTAEDWLFQTSVQGFSSRYQTLNSSGASASNDGTLVNSVSSTTFSIGTNSYVNTSGHTYISYCFAEKTGYSKFGSYVGNGNADGTFVYTGFKPAFIMVKKTNATQNWTILDTKRNPINDAELALEANLTNAEGSGNNMDILSNGFKLRATGEWGNGSGGSYIFMAFAKAPLVGTNGVTAKAR